MASFEILAEVAIGLAGFGSIAIVLSRDPTRWDAADFFRTSALLLSSLGALFLALLPVGLATAQLADASVSRVSSSITAVFFLTFATILLRMRRTHLDRAYWFSPMLFAVVAVTGLMNLSAQILNAAAVPFPPSPTVPFFGIVWFLLYACLMLVRIVFLRPREPAA